MSEETEIWKSIKDEIPINKEDSMIARLGCIAGTIKHWAYRHRIPYNQYNHLVGEIDAIVGDLEKIYKMAITQEECYKYTYCDCHIHLGQIKELTKID